MMDKVVSTALLVDVLCEKNSTRRLAESRFITEKSDLFPEPDKSSAEEQNCQKGGRPKKGMYQLTQAEAAKLLGISERTLRAWEKGVKTPDGYPGRTNVFAFRQFANSYNLQQRQMANARQMNRAATGGYSDCEDREERRW